MYVQVIKPLGDKLAALLVLLLSMPLTLPVLLLLAIANEGKPFFTQLRPGLGGKIFRIIKFKTMNDKRDKNGNLLPDSERLTVAGRFVRKTSLDEIPQMLNVLLGDMSLVGPRPLLVEYLELYSPHQARRHEVKPGITGWAQVNGRNAVSWPKRFDMDVWYVDHISFWLDLRILLLTVVKVFKSEGISSGTSVTMEKFTGQQTDSL
jgi:lipopolysaccharide/colanic/teichoic acid biosynthesis glycosyltransferase